MHIISKFRISREFPGILGSEDFYSRFPGVKKCNGSVISTVYSCMDTYLKTFESIAILHNTNFHEKLAT